MNRNPLFKLTAVFPYFAVFFLLVAVRNRFLTCEYTVLEYCSTEKYSIIERIQLHKSNKKNIADWLEAKLKTTKSVFLHV